jgi:hypothetical protein
MNGKFILNWRLNNMVNLFVEKKMKELSNIKKMVDTTEGSVKEMWTDKWYQLVRNIATAIQNTSKRTQ